MIPSGRICRLNEKTFRDRDFVLYWMQASQRVDFNHALEYAVELANQHLKPLVVFFGLTENYPRANLRHFSFMVDGLQEIFTDLKKRGILFVVQKISPEKGVVSLAASSCAVVVDRGYTRIQREWREKAAKAVDCVMVQVESDVVVPVEKVSGKEEFSAAFFRPKIKKLIDVYLKPVKKRKIKVDSIGMRFDSLPAKDPESILEKMRVDRSVSALPDWKGGIRQARRCLDNFVKKKLEKYSKNKNDPTIDGLSQLSPYLHFGQISPLEIAIRVLKSGSKGADSYLEELVVRRELSINFVWYNPLYDGFDSLPAWAQKSLDKHSSDPREYVYSWEDFELGKTHDPYWNAAQKEMVLTGKMHGYMRMYWGKKILEWSPSPQEAYETALFLNDKYELDGRDPNGYAGVAWCFGKHDRPWPERPVFGQVRYMNANGLKRKFDADQYVRNVEALEESRNL